MELMSGLLFSASLVSLPKVEGRKGWMRVCCAICNFF